MYIPNPCYENWSAMTPVEKGRHCAQCNKVVMDMTRMSNDEILALFNSGSVHCGIFNEEQLSAAPTAKGWLMQSLGRIKKEWLVASLLAMLQLAPSAEAHAESPRTEYIHQQQRTSPIDSGVALPGYIQGHLSIKQKEGVSSAYNRIVCLYTTSKELVMEFSTDTLGYFAFAIPDSLKDMPLLLVVEKHTSRRGRYVRHSTGTRKLTNGGDWVEMQIRYKKRKKLLRKRVVGCPKFR